MDVRFSGWRLVFRLALSFILVLSMIQIGYVYGRENPGPGWVRDPAADCRVLWGHCPEFHHCPGCGQHWPMPVNNQRAEPEAASEKSLVR